MGPARPLLDSNPPTPVRRAASPEEYESSFENQLDSIEHPLQGVPNTVK